MRALYLNHNVVHTGTYVRAACFARELASAGHSITIMTTSADRRSSGREWEWHGVRIIEAPDLLSGSARTGWDPWNTAWRVRRLAAERFDLIHAFDSRPAVILPALTIRRRTDAPLFLDWADWWGRGGTIEERSGWAVRTLFGPVETWFEEAFRTEATANTTIVESLSRRCIELGVPAERVRAIPNGCAPSAGGRPPREEARALLGYGDEPLLVHVGVMLPADSAFLFEAFRQTRRTLPDARLALVGRYAGPVPADVAPFVRRTGFVTDDELAQWLAAADAGVLVLRDTVASRGRWPGKLSSYLSAGVPLVMTRVGAAADLLGAAGAAALADPTPPALADAIVGVLQAPSVQAVLSKRAQAVADGELAWTRMTERLIDFYRQWGVAAA